jgi:orotidine-5'-phosphate decarboxylase
MVALEPGERIIVALDIDSFDRAAELIDTLAPLVGGFAIGNIAIAEAWDRRAIEMVRERDQVAFYDVHLTATPRITGRAVEAYTRWGMTHLSICGTAGERSIEAAVAQRGEVAIVVTTVLTSFSENDVRWEYGRRAEEVVYRHAQAAVRAGAQAILCSPQELAYMRGRPRIERVAKIVNGIRLDRTRLEADDLQRIMRPAEAIAAGADYLLIGRPIFDPPSGTPREAVEHILAEIGA